MIPENLTHAVAMSRADEPLIPIIAAYVNIGTFIDIGANIGVYTHHLRKAARRIVAFEPVESLAATLRRRYPEVEVHACALSDREGEATLCVPSRDGHDVLPRSSLNADANPGFALSNVTVPVRRLDDFGIRDASVIKIDVEGHEEEVVLGALETIKATRPVLVVEIEERHHPGRSAPLIRSIERLGYAPFFHDGGGLTSAKDFDFTTRQRPDQQKQAFQKASSAYVNNFIFLKTQ